jgi:hypothetical protein
MVHKAYANHSRSVYKKSKIPFYFIETEKSYIPFVRVNLEMNIMMLKYYSPSNYEYISVLVTIIWYYFGKA